MTYPLGWSIIPQMLIRRERWPGGYQTRGTALVYPGQDVQADQPVIRLEKSVRAGGFPRISSLSPSDSTLAGYQVAQKDFPSNIQHINGIILAGLRGKVIGISPRGGVIIDTRAAIIQGTIGAGGQVAGTLTIWNSNSHLQSSGITTSSTILVIPGPLNLAMLHQALNSRVAGIVASSISSRDLEGFLGANLIALINSMDIELAHEHLPPLTLLLADGLGTAAMPARTINLLNRYQGSTALLAGTTSIRHSVYPELIISLPVQEIQRNWRPVQPDPTLTVGSQVRICSGSYEGAIGEIIFLYIYQQTFASGVRSRAARVRIEDGSTLIMPLTLLERIG
jgi:hypothetical protein